MGENVKRIFFVYSKFLYELYSSMKIKHLYRNVTGFTLM